VQPSSLKKIFSGVIPLGLLILAGLYLISIYSYLLFHSVAEVFGVVISISLYLIAWNSRKIVRNNYLLFLGIAFLFVGIIDLLHTLSYRGMGVFPNTDTTLATQLWVGARYFQSISLLIAPIFLKRKMNEITILTLYSAAFVFLIVSTFIWPVFPISYIDGVGLTPFKIYSEYIISLIFLASVFFLRARRGSFDPLVYQLMIYSTLTAIISELSMTLYTDVYGYFNMLGHFLKIASFYFLYRAIVYTALAEPYTILFRDLKESEQLLEKERDRAKTYFDRAGVILVVIGTDEKVMEINRKGTEILGYNEKELIGRNWFDIVIPENIREDLRGKFRQLLKEDAIIHDITPEGFETPVLTRSVEEKLIAWNNSILRDENNEVVGTLSSGEDITERRRIEELKRYKELFENVEDVVFILDREGRFIEANDKLFEKTGYIREEMSSLTIRDIIRQEQVPFVAGIEEKLKNERSVQFEFGFRNKEGKDIPFFINCLRILYRGEKGFLFVARDITQIKLLQEQLIRSERLAATGRMAASIVHEIKNPLTTIGGLARSIPNKYDDRERTLRNAEIIVEEIARMEHLLSDMLDFSKPAKPRKVKTDLNGLISDTVSMLKGEITSHGIEFSMDIKGKKLELEADPDQIKQVFINVIQNAIHAMHGGGRLSVKTATGKPGAQVFIQDTGPGIPPENLEKIFEPFFTTTSEGTGLGLAISQKIVQSHGGTIMVASETGKGSTFTITLPL
jgi:PAS domain S-box-containing protein